MRSCNAAKDDLPASFFWHCESSFKPWLQFHCDKLRINAANVQHFGHSNTKNLDAVVEIRTCGPVFKTLIVKT